MKKYKAWLYIEEVIDGEEYQDITDPIIIGDFDDKDEALEFADGLYVTRPQK